MESTHLGLPPEPCQNRSHHAHALRFGILLSHPHAGQRHRGGCQPGCPAGFTDAAAIDAHGFEIIDKRSGKEVYLDGSWAELFQQHISAWQLKTPTQEEVEGTLEQYAVLAQNPVVMH